MRNRSGHKDTGDAGSSPEGALRVFFSQSPAAQVITDPDKGTIVDINTSFERMSGYDRDMLAGQAFVSVCRRAGRKDCPEMTLRARGGQERNVLALSDRITIDGRGCILTCIQDITELQGVKQELAALRERFQEELAEKKKAQARLQSLEKELQEKLREIDELNAALKVLVRQRIEDRAEVENSVLANMKASVLPFLEKLKDSRLSESCGDLLSEIELHINEITSPFVREIASPYLGLSPNEVQVASLIKEGKSSKEIARLLNISIHTVVSYRYGIRKKTGIKGRKVNLRAYLQHLKHD